MKIHERGGFLFLEVTERMELRSGMERGGIREGLWVYNYTDTGQLTRQQQVLGGTQFRAFGPEDFAKQAEQWAREHQWI